MSFFESHSFLISKRIGSVSTPCKRLAQLRIVPRCWDTEANSFWMLLSGNAEDTFPSRTTTIVATANLSAPATATASPIANVAAVAASVMSALTTDYCGCRYKYCHYFYCFCFGSYCCCCCTFCTFCWSEAQNTSLILVSNCLDKDFNRKVDDTKRRRLVNAKRRMLDDTKRPSKGLGPENYGL
jgi:hypothetical protein